MPKFTAKTPIKFAGERYEENDEIELTDKQAQPLLASGEIEPRAAAEQEKKGKK